jgi:hypothetical protein
VGFFSDALDFEKYWIKDLWKGVKDDPKRLVLGVDPLSTSAWNTVLGRDDKALVNQLGGPPSRTYENAEAAGVPTDSGRTMHGIAQTVAGMYGAAGLGGAAGNVFGGSAQGAQPGLWNQAFSGTSGFSGAPYGSAPAQGIGGIAGPVGGGTGAGASAGLGGMDYAKLGMQAMGQMQSQQPPQQQAPPPPVKPMAQPNPVPTYGQRIAGGLGRVGQALFPVDPNTGMTPDQMKALQTSGMMQMGLGMLGASGRGAGFGESLARGYGFAQGNVQGAMQQAYENAMKNRAETRAGDREKRLDEHQKWLTEHTLEREKTADARYDSDRAYRTEQDKLAQDRWKAEQDAMAKWRDQQLTKAADNPEVRVTDRGMFEKDPKTGKWELVEGTEPTGVAGRPIPQGMAADLTSNATVIGLIDKVLPQIRTPDGKIDPKADAAFGARNAVIDAMTPDAISDNLKNFADSGGTDLRATITNLNSTVVKDRNGSAVTVAEFARQRGFLPTDKDNAEIIEKKLKNLREALSSEQQYILDFAESQGYKAPPASVRPSGTGLGQRSSAPVAADPLGIR